MMWFSSFSLPLSGLLLLLAHWLPTCESYSIASGLKRSPNISEYNRFRVRLSANVPTSSSPTSKPLSSTPSTFLDCVKQAVIGAQKALSQGEKLIEVEFPPLPLEFLEDSSSSARDIADANTRWAFEFAKSFTHLGQVSIIYPDKPELEDAVKYVDMPGGYSPYPNITLATIRSDSIDNAKSLDQILLSVFGATVGGTVESVPNTSLYIALISSTQELPDLEKLHLLDPSIPIVFFNLRLDILRGDLGLPLFPGRDLHHRFLSRVLPVYFLRSRSFATSLRKPPFIVNFTGQLFRVYPEPYQTLLSIGGGKNRLVDASPDRPSNLGFREALSNGLKIPGVSSDDLRQKGNLIWWEKELDKESSDNWRK